MQSNYCQQHQRGSCSSQRSLGLRDQGDLPPTPILHKIQGWPSNANNWKLIGAGPSSSFSRYWGPLLKSSAPVLQNSGEVCATPSALCYPSCISFPGSYKYRCQWKLPLTGSVCPGTSRLCSLHLHVVFLLGFCFSVFSVDKQIHAHMYL